MLESLRVTKCTLSHDNLCFSAIYFGFVEYFEADGMPHFIRDKWADSCNHIDGNICFLVVIVLQGSLFRGRSITNLALRLLNDHCHRLISIFGKAKWNLLR